MEQKVAPKRRTKTAEQALQALMRQCARAERSSGDAMRLMATWCVPEAERQGVLQHLLRDKFIDDSRYAEAFVRDKLNLSGWGGYKIKMALRAKGVSKDIVEEVVAPMIAETNMVERLEEIMVRKMRTLKYSSAYDAKTKLIRFAASRGYDMEQAIECASQVVKIDED